jgi:hypothetical protein
VSELEATEIRVIALVFPSLLISIVNFLITLLSVRFLILLLTADSDKPIVYAISTNGFLASF